MKSPTRIGITGLSINPEKGKMATAVAEKIVQDTSLILIGGFSRNYNGEASIGGKNISIQPFSTLQASLVDIVIDYTSPDSALSNVQLYTRLQIPFVMGTTGADFSELHEIVRNGGNSAVIAPNMAKEIVAFQSMLEHLQQFPYLFQGFTLDIVESHQSGKKDTSGTAKAVKAIFEELGASLDEKGIKMIRSVEEQQEFGVPENHLSGHAYHTYNLKKPDGSLFMSFTHNINGRDIYASGTVDAIKFLETKIEKQEYGSYNMIDVLKGNK